MKKATFITIIAALLLLVSCNVDSEHGIYYQVSTALPSSGINIVQSLGYDDTTDTHYFLADDGICYTTGTKGDTEYVEGSKGKNIRGAYFDYTDFYYSVYSTEKGNVYKLGVSDPVAMYSNYNFNVNPTGFVYNTDYYALIGGGSVEEANPKIHNQLFSGKSMLTMDGTTKAIVYFDTFDPETITGLSSIANGFLEGTYRTSEAKCYLFQDKSIYEIAGGGAIGDAMCSGLEAAPTGGYKAVEYSDGTTYYLLVRTSKGFTKINAETGVILEKNVQFLSTLNDVVVIDMYELEPFSGNGKVAIVTYANGIRIADMVNKTVSNDIL